MDENLTIYCSLEAGPLIMAVLARFFDFAGDDDYGTVRWGPWGGDVRHHKELGLVLLTLIDVYHATDIARLCHLFQLLLFCEEVTAISGVDAIILGSSDEVEASDLINQAKQSAAFYPVSLLPEKMFIQIGAFSVSIYALDRLTPSYSNLSSFPWPEDQGAIDTLNEFLRRMQADDDGRAAWARARLAQMKENGL